MDYRTVEYQIAKGQLLDERIAGSVDVVRRWEEEAEFV